jgi:hypothetical protein
MQIKVGDANGPATVVNASFPLGTAPFVYDFDVPAANQEWDIFYFGGHTRSRAGSIPFRPLLYGTHPTQWLHFGQCAGADHTTIACSGAPRIA